MNIVLKSGTNAFHGDLFEFVRNNSFNARDFFAGNFERRPMIGARARKRQPECDIRCGMKRMQLQRNQTLVVIHA